MEYRKIDILNSEDDWKKFIDKIPPSEMSLAFNPDFAHIFCDVFNLTPEYYLIYEKGKVIGGIPGFRRNKKFLSVPVLSSAGIHITDDKYRNNDYYENFLKQIGNNFEIRSFNKITNYYYSDKVTCYKNLSSSSDDLLSSFKSKLRSQIKKGYKNGLTVVIGRGELIDDFYRLYSINMHRLGTPVNSKNFFKSFIDHYKNGDARLFIVKFNDKVVGASITFSVRKFFEVMWASTDRDFNNLNTNMVLYWEMMKYSIGTNMEIFSFGRSNKSSSSLKFKRQWGINEHPLFFNYSTLKKNIREYRAINKIWKKIPYKLTLVLGPIIRKRVIN